MIGANYQIARVAEETVLSLKELETRIELLKNDLTSLCTTLGHPEAARIAATSARWLDPRIEAHKAYTLQVALASNPYQAVQAAGLLGSVSPWSVASPLAVGAYGGISPFAGVSPLAGIGSPLGIGSLGIGSLAGIGALGAISPFSAVAPFAGIGAVSPVGISPLSAAVNPAFAASAVTPFSGFR